MVTFEQEVWRKRALARYKKAVSGLSPDKQETAKLKLVNDNKSISNLNNLIEWCTANGVKVLFSKKAAGIYFPVDKVIKINCRLSPEKQLFLLLHECGHHLIGTKGSRDRYGMGHYIVAKQTLHHRCDIIDEEFEAWHRGLKLAKRLGLKLNKNRFNQVKIQMLRTYFMWALNPTKFEKTDEQLTDD